MATTGNISISGLVTSPPSNPTKTSRYFDMVSFVDGGELKVHVKIPKDTSESILSGIQKDTMLSIIGGRIYKSIDSSDSNLAISTNAKGVNPFVQGACGNCISYTGDIVSDIRATDSQAEFIVSDLSDREKSLAIHVICEGAIFKERFPFEKGDRIAIIGGTIELNDTDKNSSFIVRVALNDLCLIPSFDGKEDANNLKKED